MMSRLLTVFTNRRLIAHIQRRKIYNPTYNGKLSVSKMLFSYEDPYIEKRLTIAFGTAATLSYGTGVVLSLHNNIPPVLAIFTGAIISCPCALVLIPTICIPIVFFPFPTIILLSYQCFLLFTNKTGDKLIFSRD